ncbi:MAG: response regulator [Candidatus Xenobia bacterium]
MGARGKILVADDNPDIARLVEVNLKFEGYDTCIASNGAEAIEMANTQRPDAIVLDIMLPRLDGWQVLKTLKGAAETKNIPVILLTGMNLEDRKERELVEEVEQFVSKPFNPMRLVEIVDEVVQVRRRKGTEAPKPAHTRVRVVVVGGDKTGTAILRTLLGNPRIRVEALICDPRNEGASLAQELGIPCLQKLDEVRTADVIVDTEGTVAVPRGGVEVVRGQGVDLLLEVVMAREESARKERGLVRELNARIQELSVLSEMAEVLSASLNMWELSRRVLALVQRLDDVQASALLLYDEDSEKFVPRMRSNLSEDYDRRAQMGLFDPLIEELFTLRRPVAMETISEQVRSALVLGGLAARMQSMAAIPMVVKDRLIGVLVCYGKQSHPWRHEEVSLLSTLAGQAAIAIENVRLYETEREKQRQVEQLLGKVIQAQEEERKRVATEIHDGVAQTMVGMLTMTQTAMSLLEVDKTATAQQLEELKKVIGDSVKEIRQIIFNLRPSALDNLGLVLCLQNYVKRYERESGINVAMDIGGAQRRLPPTLETTVFRLVQESLTNVKKHAAAQHVRIRITIDQTHVAIRVADDGRGFNWSEVTEKFLKGDSHGLEGMKERAALMRGKLNVISGEGKGTVVEVEIPIERGNEDEQQQPAASEPTTAP